jgi:hypothetical protein
MVTGLEPEAWETFAVGQLGASAALLGLVFVGISINLQNVLASRHLVNRAAEAVVLLTSLLVSSTAVLVPGQGARPVGIELLVIGLVVLGAVLVFQRTVAGSPGSGGEQRDAAGPALAHAFRRVLGAGAGLLLAIAGASLLLDGGGGLYWWAGAVVLAYGGALLGGWVLLIEILR